MGARKRLALQIHQANLKTCPSPWRATHLPCASTYLNLFRCRMRHAGACLMSSRFCASCRQQQWSQKNLSSLSNISVALIVKRCAGHEREGQGKEVVFCRLYD